MQVTTRDIVQRLDTIVSSLNNIQPKKSVEFRPAEGFISSARLLDGPQYQEMYTAHHEMERLFKALWNDSRREKGGDLEGLLRETNLVCETLVQMSKKYSATPLDSLKETVCSYPESTQEEQVSHRRELINSIGKVQTLLEEYLGEGSELIANLKVIRACYDLGIALRVDLPSTTEMIRKSSPALFVQQFESAPTSPAPLPPAETPATPLPQHIPPTLPSRDVPPTPPPRDFLRKIWITVELYMLPKKPAEECKMAGYFKTNRETLSAVKELFKKWQDNKGESRAEQDKKLQIALNMRAKLFGHLLSKYEVPYAIISEKDWCGYIEKMELLIENGEKELEEKQKQDKVDITATMTSGLNKMREANQLTPIKPPPSNSFTPNLHEWGD